MKEQWKDISGYEGLYRISNKGKVKSITHRKCVHGISTISAADILMKPFDNGKGYMVISLVKNGKRKNHYIHRLVAEAFIANPNKLKEVNHKDYDKSNNSISNLEWCTRQENIDYSACNRAAQHNFAGKTGIRYVGIDKKGRYRVNIPKAKVDKRFTAKEDAIAFRNEVLNGINYTI